MPLLVLCDPGFAASVGVSKPAGASAADCCALARHAPVIPPSRHRRAAILLHVIVSSSEEWLCPRRVPRRQEGAVVSSSRGLYPAGHGLDGFLPDCRRRHGGAAWSCPGQDCETIRTDAGGSPRIAAHHSREAREHM